MSSIAAYFLAQALVTEPRPHRAPTPRPGIVSRVRRSVGRTFAGPSIDRTERYLDVPTLSGYPFGR
jgi:hypothetical protein